jgi:hypothetical protein
LKRWIDLLFGFLIFIFRFWIGGRAVCTLSIVRIAFEFMM